jgi:hypothetical protein
MTKANFSILFIVLGAQLCLAQQKGAFVQFGETFTGNIRTIRMKTAHLKSGSNGALVEAAPVLEELMVYSEDLLTRELISYHPDGSVRSKSVETHSPDGMRISLTVTWGDGSFVSHLVYDYDEQGRQISETSYNSDESVKAKTPMQLTLSRDRITGVTWPDGRRAESTSEVDEAGTHHNESITYEADGSVTGRRVWTVTADGNRYEATEYSAYGSISNRSLQKREYDSRHNPAKLTNYTWNDESQKFEPSRITYYKIIYRD